MWYSHYLQTLTTLDLGSNEIGDKGLKFLADALAVNQVRTCLMHIRPIIYVISTLHRQ